MPDLITFGPSIRDAYNGSFYTILGAGGDLHEWVDGYTETLSIAGIGKPKVFIQTTGAEVNAFANTFAEVADDNKFRDDLSILMFPLDGLNVGELAMFKIQNGDRWFDDIVNNMTGDFD